MAYSTEGSSMEGIRRARRLLQRVYWHIQRLVMFLQQLLQAEQECEPRQETFHCHLSSQLVNYLVTCLTMYIAYVCCSID